MSQSDEADMDQKSNENVIVVFQEGKQMNLSDEIDERTLQYDSAENRLIQEDCQKKNEAENGSCD